MPESVSEPGNDPRLDAVESALRSIPDLVTKLREGIARAVDEVVDPVRSGRWRIDQLDQPEKTVIGIRVENILRMELGLDRPNHLDVLVGDQAVDVKFTMRANWTIPPEAVGEICLLTQYNSKTQEISAGLLRTTDEVLNEGRNRDLKRTVGKAGRKQIRWLVDREHADTSVIAFMARLDSHQRAELTDATVGAQIRVNRLFQMFKGVPISEEVVQAVAQHFDWTRRLRPDAANPNGPEQQGFEVLRSTSPNDRARIRAMGLPDLKRGYCMSIDTG